MRTITFKTVLYGDTKSEVLAVDLTSLSNGNVDCYQLFNNSPTPISKDWLRRNTRTAKLNETVSVQSHIKRLGIQFTTVNSLKS